MLPLHYASMALTLQDRTKRVKDARTEAQKEIDEYRKEKDEEFKAFEKEVRFYSLAIPATATIRC